MSYPKEIILKTLHLYAEGLSLSKIRDLSGSKKDNIFMIALFYTGLGNIPIYWKNLKRN